MAEIMENIVICDTVRTPFSHGGRLKDTGPEQLLATVIKKLLERNNLKGSEVSAVVTGTVLQDSRHPNIARQSAMMAGLPETSADYTIQNNCNSAFVGLLSAVGALASRQGDLYLCTGVESMSRYGLRLEDSREEFGSAAEAEELLKNDMSAFTGQYKMVDCLEECLTDHSNNLSMIEIGEIMANLFGISREEQDSYTLENLKKAVAAVEEGKLKDYIVPIGDFDTDSYPLNRKRMIRKPELFGRTALIFGEDNPELNSEAFFAKHRINLEALGISRIDPTVTMYTSSIPGDGAGGCLLTTESRAKELGLKPRFRLSGWASVGVNPLIMGIGPMEAVEKLFKHPTTSRGKGLTMEDVDLIEIHEAFASQVLSVFRESEKRYGRKWDRSRINPYGGSLAYTHPLGATNYRMMANVFSRFDENPELKTALLTGCAGGGQGTALLLSRY